MKQAYENAFYSFNEKHGGKYSYPRMPEKITARTVIDIECPVHGAFKQKAVHHAQGSGCKKCAADKNKTARPQTAVSRDEWAARFQSVHGKGVYDYSRLPQDMLRMKKVEIYCPEHDVCFYQKPDTHWRSGKGCPECGRAKQGLTKKNKIISRKKYEALARAVHGGKYEYAELPHEFSLHDSIIVYCNEHDRIFFITALDHLKGEGCGHAPLP